jgi:hypothetical protein
VGGCCKKHFGSFFLSGAFFSLIRRIQYEASRFPNLQADNNTKTSKALREQKYLSFSELLPRFATSMTLTEEQKKRGALRYVSVFKGLCSGLRHVPIQTCYSSVSSNVGSAARPRRLPSIRAHTLFLELMTTGTHLSAKGPSPTWPILHRIALTIIQIVKEVRAAGQRGHPGICCIRKSPRFSATR